MLKVEGLHVAIQGVQALRGLSLDVPGGTMVGLVGRNGAGKTTLLRSVMGHLQPSQGRIHFDARGAVANCRSAATEPYGENRTPHLHSRCFLCLLSLHQQRK